MKNTKIMVRLATESDTQALCEIFNEIVRIGGSTAYQTPFNFEKFNSCFINGMHCVSCNLAVDQGGLILGFQSISHHQELPADWLDIATFARVQPKVAGVGRILFSQTLALTKKLGYVSINATIRADNISGLAYYNKMGFCDYSINKAVPLSDGTNIDRISKQYKL